MKNNTVPEHNRRTALMCTEELVMDTALHNHQQGNSSLKAKKKKKNFKVSCIQRSRLFQSTSKKKPRSYPDWTPRPLSLPWINHTGPCHSGFFQTTIRPTSPPTAFVLQKRKWIRFKVKALSNIRRCSGPNFGHHLKHKHKLFCCLFFNNNRRF